MSRDLVRVSAPSRLHFGLLRFAQAEGPSYGGLGMMIDRPRVVVRLQPADRWQAVGPLADRALVYAKQALAAWPHRSVHALELQISAAAPPHCGLGTGTQLALAVAVGLRKVCGQPQAELGELVAVVRRGQRSAVGSHGFFRGGLLWETGRLAEETLGRLARRVVMPDAWRVVLITPLHDHGLYGDQEVQAFEQLPPVSPEVTQRLKELAESEILPAADRADLPRFGESVFQYGRLAGSCFAAIQGGPYASPRIARTIDRLRCLGVAGVGQSSWGPTVFALVADDNAAAALIDRLKSCPECADCRLSLAAPDNQGARVEKITIPEIAR